VSFFPHTQSKYTIVSPILCFVSCPVARLHIWCPESKKRQIDGFLLRCLTIINSSRNNNPCNIIRVIITRPLCPLLLRLPPLHHIQISSIVDPDTHIIKLEDKQDIWLNYPRGNTLIIPFRLLDSALRQMLFIWVKILLLSPQTKLDCNRLWIVLLREEVVTPRRGHSNINLGNIIIYNSYRSLLSEERMDLPLLDIISAVTFNIEDRNNHNLDFLDQFILFTTLNNNHNLTSNLITLEEVTRLTNHSQLRREIRPSFVKCVAF